MCVEKSPYGIVANMPDWSIVVSGVYMCVEKSPYGIVANMPDWSIVVSGVYMCVWRRAPTV